MKINLISEDYPEGLIVHWPAAPGTGDTVSFRYPGGTSVWKVESVEYEANSEHRLTGVTVHLQQ
ncbi:hypothetical protein FZ934_07855 [Rhizobium grahamii]|uniref:Uncharacterized protein n=1 Tax=Rhizobium grahamii TaxID=1120045 RepID=A0A5Q0C7Q9_9HYPH|nr:MULTISPECIES: hypothetical protein [Rhizobium]QFY60354.1 hypothetical protein FZ934_07855 [Rhizobium grahamii]QRM50520.1 hypothetical protein F3Y33_15035 [Rhizobium sp. BG6]